MDEDVNANTTTTRTAGFPRNEASSADVVKAEILKSVTHTTAVTGGGTLAHNAILTTTWSPRSISLNCCKSPAYIYAGPTYGRYRNTFNMISTRNLNNQDSQKILENDSASLNGSLSDAFGRIPRSTARRSESEVSTSRSEPPKKVTPVKLMRTPSAVFRKRSSGSGTSPSDGKRLDEEMEELDAHLMGTTLKNIKFMHGSAKFTVFSK